MEYLLTGLVYLYGFISLIITLAGAIICIRGFKKSRRYLFAYAAIYFSLTTITQVTNMALPAWNLFPDYINITINFTRALVFVSPLALVLVIWGFYRESHAD